MTREGRKAAGEHALKLRHFDSQPEAQAALVAGRDEALRELVSAAKGGGFDPNYSPASLKELEAWFFALHEVDFVGAPLKREAMERGMAMYFGEVCVRNAGFEWRVREYAFERGKYEMGVVRGLLGIMLSSFSDLPVRPNNKRHQSMWSEYRKYVG